MPTLVLILLFTLIGSIGALIGGVILLSREKFALRISHFLAAFSAGVLLGTAFSDLLPEALQEAEGKGIDIFFWTLLGIVIFFFAERFIHWFHHHEEFHKDKKETKSTLPLIIFGDTMHNFIDGVVIAATFLTNIQVGIITALAVFAHELPQEIGDFGLMLDRGLSRKKVLLVNIVSAAVAFAGALLTYVFGGFLERYLPVFLALTAGFFIYISASDLIPEIHYERRKGYAFIETILFLIGIIVIWTSVSFLEQR